MHTHLFADHRRVNVFIQIFAVGLNRKRYTLLVHEAVLYKRKSSEPEYKEPQHTNTCDQTCRPDRTWQVASQGGATTHKHMRPALPARPHVLTLLFYYDASNSIVKTNCSNYSYQYLGLPQEVYKVTVTAV